jgi:hypothetical protein
MMIRRLGPNSKKKLSHGKEHKLTRSEVNRGYLFISNAKYSNEFLNKNFTVIFDGRQFNNRKLDNSGRVYIGTKFLRKYVEKPLIIRLKDRNTIVITPL